MPAEIILMRHGQIIQVEPRRFIGQRDIPLDETGREQAESAGRYLSDRNIVRVVASDLSRTMETARIVCRDRTIEIEPEPRLREINLGAWEGLTTEEVRARFPGQYEQRGNDMAGFRPENGESFLDAQNRAWPALESIAHEAANLDTTPSPTILITAHAGINRTLLCRLLGMPLKNLFRLDQDYCGMNILRFSKGQWILKGLNIRA